jgi:hypothetical protein
MKIKESLQEYLHYINLNLQVSTYLNPELNFLGQIYNFLILHIQKHELKTTFVITIFNPMVVVFILTIYLDL